MKNVFIIHGAYGNPEENWFPWLKSELEKQGYNVFVPTFPTPDEQNLDNWLKVIGKYKNYFNNETIVIGHSIGAGFLLNIIEQLNITIKAAFLVSGWVGLLNDPLDEINKTFVDRKFDWNKIKINCEKFFVYNSDNDPYIPLKLGQDLANNLGVDLILVKNGGHINIKAGFIEFPLILENIITLIK